MTTIRTLLAAAAISAAATSAFADSSRKSDVDVYNYGPRAPIALAAEAPAPRAAATARFVPQLPTGLVATAGHSDFTQSRGVPYGARPDSARPGSDR